MWRVLWERVFFTGQLQPDKLYSLSDHLQTDADSIRREALEQQDPFVWWGMLMQGSVDSTAEQAISVEARGGLVTV